MRRSSTIDREVDGRIERTWTRRSRTDRCPFRALIRCCLDPRRQRPVGDDDPGRDRPRHEPLPDRRASGRLGRAVPGQNESAGKRKSSRLRKGAPWLKTMLVQCAWAAKRQKNSYYTAQFHRLKSRRGPQKAICAVAASMLTADLSHAEQRHARIRISAPTTSIAARPKPKPGVWSLNSPSSDTRQS